MGIETSKIPRWTLLGLGREDAYPVMGIETFDGTIIQGRLLGREDAYPVMGIETSHYCCIGNSKHKA